MKNGHLVDLKIQTFDRLFDNVSKSLRVFCDDIVAACDTSDEIKKFEEWLSAKGYIRVGGTGRLRSMWLKREDVL